MTDDHQHSNECASYKQCREELRLARHCACVDQTIMDVLAWRCHWRSPLLNTMQCMETLRCMRQTGQVHKSLTCQAYVQTLHGTAVVTDRVKLRGVTPGEIPLQLFISPAICVRNLSRVTICIGRGAHPGWCEDKHFGKHFLTGQNNYTACPCPFQLSKIALIQQ